MRYIWKLTLFLKKRYLGYTNSKLKKLGTILFLITWGARIYLFRFRIPIISFTTSVCLGVVETRVTLDVLGHFSKVFL